MNSQESQLQLPFSINSKIYESELDERYGMTLNDIKRNTENKVNESLLEKLQFREGANYPKDKIMKLIVEKYLNLPGKLSMLVRDKDELMGHISKIYEMSYTHYAWAKGFNLGGSFPYWACTFSSRNLFLSLMAIGYPNTSYFYNSHGNHAYVGLPFVLEKPQTKGFILVDPTSDQLFENKKIAPRNNVFVVENQDWEYITDWREGRNLHPSENNKGKILCLENLRRDITDDFEYSRDVSNFFQKVFENSRRLSEIKS